MASDTGPGKPNKESPGEPLKRAVSGTLRAIAGRSDLDVTYAAERPQILPGQVKLPEPPRRMSKKDAAILRGQADSLALKLACHDPKVHSRLLPKGTEARAVFEAVEQARCEAIGARRMT